MLRITPALIVTILLGGPGVSLACELWCVSPAGEGHHTARGCHDPSVPLAGDARILPTAACHAPELTFFLSETKQNAPPAPAISPAAPSPGSLPNVRGGSFDGRRAVTPDRALPPEYRAILRI